MQAHLRDGRVRLLMITGVDWTDRYPLIVKGMRRIKAKSAILDGEAALCDHNGIAVFDRLVERIDEATACFLAFDLLELNGEDLRKRPLLERKSKLRTLLGSKPRVGLAYVRHVKGDGTAHFENACKLGLEGIVSKYGPSSYKSGKAKTWVKVKNPKAPGFLRHVNGEW